MANAVANTHCPDCGASYALVGRVHRCIPKTSDESKRVSSAVANVSREAPSVTGSTYRYRDPEKRKPYMAGYMKAYRARKKSNG